MMEEVNSSDTEPKAFTWRWVILVLSGLVIGFNSCIWISFSAITSIAERYYNVSAVTVDHTSIVFFASGAVFAIPSAYVLSRYGLRISILIPALFTAIGTSIRIGGVARNQFIFIEVGQAVTSLGVVFILIITSQIAAVWFPANERTFATSCGMIFNFIGVALGFLMSTCMVPNTDNITEIGDGIRNMLVVQAVISFAIFLMVIALFKESPPTAPSISEYLRPKLTQEGHFQFWFSVLGLLRNYNYIIVTIAYSLNFIVSFSISTVLSQIVEEKLFDKSLASKEIRSGWIGFSGYLTSIVSIIIVSFILDRSKRFKKMSCITMFLSTISTISFAITVHYRVSLSVIGVLFVLVMVTTVPFLASGLDHLSEIGYPIPEGCSCMLPMIFGNSFGVAMVYLMQLAIDNGKKDVVSYVFCILEAISLILLLVAEEPRSRTVTDNIQYDEN